MIPHPKSRPLVIRVRLRVLLPLLAIGYAALIATYDPCDGGPCPAPADTITAHEVLP